MPKITAEITEVKVKFYGLARFPKVISVVDYMYIKLQSPSRENGEQYRNRKGYSSLNLQILVNANSIQSCMSVR